MITNTIALVGLIVTNYVTNWSDAGASVTAMWPPEANTTTYYEQGTVQQVVSLQIEYDNKKHLIELSNKVIEYLTRTYSVEQKKVYSPTRSLYIVQPNGQPLTTENITIDLTK